MKLQNGSLLLFRLFGVNVFVHWSWALVAVFQIWLDKTRGLGGDPRPLFFHIALYLTLFLIVLIHEFGHALACKSVGGLADRIILWPLGGLAFVQPPQRAGALLWSIVAGPLVNVVLVPITVAAAFFAGLYQPRTLLAEFTFLTALMNGILLVFNMLPIYPLDGGQILRALLWFAVGRARSLTIAGVIGVVGAVGLAIAAFFLGSIFTIVLVGFMGLQAMQAIRMGKALARFDNLPLRSTAHCPACGKSPPMGNLWGCPCGMQFDTFESGGQCPRCQRAFDRTACVACGQASPLAQWYPAGHVALEPSSGASLPR